MATSSREENNMRTKRAARPKKHPSRQILGMAVSLLGMSLMLLVISLVFKARPDAMLQAVGKGFGVPVPYALFLGACLLVIWWVIRPKPEPGPQSSIGPTLFGKDSMDFASQMDRGADEAGPHRGERAPATAWSARVFEDIEWRRFEALCESLFAQAGFETRSQSHGADGGVDIWLYSQNAVGPAAVVQCKHWLGKPVGVKEMREFYGVMASHKLQRGTFATSSTFTLEARQFAKDNGISMLDGHALLALISRRTAAQQAALLEIAYQGEYWRPTCASCGVKMAERSARASNSTFWGCVHFPRCRFTLPVRAAS
jgi:restriction system protein